MIILAVIVSIPMVTSFNKQWVWFLLNYIQSINSGFGAALTAKIDKSNTVNTTNITMQSLRFILRLLKVIGSLKSVFLLKSQVLFVPLIIFSPHFFTFTFSLCTNSKFETIYKKREREHLKTNGGLHFKCITSSVFQ